MVETIRGVTVVQKLLLTALLSSVLFLSGCISTMNFDMNNQTQQIVVKTSIQLATVTYLGKSPSQDSVNLVLEMTGGAMVYLTDVSVSNDTILSVQKKLHKLIASKELTVQQKIALTSLSDVIIAQAVSWATINVADKLTASHVNILFFCADTMNEVAKMYVRPESIGRSYSVITTSKEPI